MRQQIQELFEKAMRVSGAVGAQLSIVRDGEQLDFCGGLANAELGIPMTPDTVIQCGSVTKTFTAAMIMSLVEEGTLDLDTPVIRYLPTFALADMEAARTITLRHLLSMSAGIDNGDYGNYGSGEDSVAKRVAGLRTLPQHFEPGTGFGYSNAGTDVVGHVAEVVTGKIWDVLLKEHVIGPLELKNAVTLDSDRMYQRVSVGHAVDPQTGAVQVVRPWGLGRGLGPAGGTLTISSRDLVRFARIFLERGQSASGRQILAAESVQRMMTPTIASQTHYQATAWGVGPCLQKWNDISVWGHRGGNISGVAFIYWMPERNCAMAWVMNTVAVLPRWEKVVVQELMQAAFGFHKPEIKAPGTPVSIDPRRYVGTYFSHGARCTVEATGSQLVVKKVMKDYVDESREMEDSVALVPLGDDRFLMDRGEAADPSVMVEDTGFFGSDSEGRAHNFIHFVFPCSRVS